MDWNLFWIFVVLNVVNVIIQTVKSIATIKCGKVAAAIVNALAYGLYTIVVVYTVCALPLWLKAMVVAVANLVGVYVVKVLEEKARKDKLWKVELACPINSAMELHQHFLEYNISHNYEKAGKWFIFNCYCATQTETWIVVSAGKERQCKISAYESKVS